jgi:hypothetical protein
MIILNFLKICSIDLSSSVEVSITNYDCNRDRGNSEAFFFLGHIWINH